ncbi:hypothetical protein FGO68_gene15609 [Halteria grandinella]|uniref:Uncharacterized protein n=1 Tax=Halteria grandinella TaxID=5974 RepID=A0A8J8SW99_HALGN|nr:hypothetical protein FGO68_gene15609 [Halteria grandinella]
MDVIDRERGAQVCVQKILRARDKMKRRQKIYQKQKRILAQILYCQTFLEGQKYRNLQQFEAHLNQDNLSTIEKLTSQYSPCQQYYCMVLVQFPQ